MNTKYNIEQRFEKLSPVEKIMQEYHRLKDSPDKLSEFIKEINLEQYKCFLPGISDTAWEVFTENNMFPGGGNIQVSQHLRYTPEFSHMHTMFEIIYVLKGNCVNKVRNTNQRLTAGDFCILKPNVPHTIGVFDESLVFNILIKKSTFNETFFKLMAGNHMLSDFFTNIIYTRNAADYLLFHTTEDAKFSYLAQQLIKESLEEDAYTNICMENTLMLLFSQLLRNHQDTAEIPTYTQATHNKIPEILQYIEQHYKTVKLEKLAEAFFYTPAYMSRIIKEATGNSFSQILSSIKINKALTLLTSTEMNISEISETLGYESAAYFHRKFKRAMNMTPQEYRIQNETITRIKT